jgi:hypothetical protein
MGEYNIDGQDLSSTTMVERYKTRHLKKPLNLLSDNYAILSSSSLFITSDNNNKLQFTFVKYCC